MAAAATLTKIRFEKATPAIGARVQGVALDETATPEIVQALREGLHEHGVLFFELGEGVEEAQQRNFARLFGELEPVYGFSTEQQEAQAKRGSGGLIDADFQPLKEYRTAQWHTDGTPFERPPQAAILTAVEPPELGGGTMWASMYAAYEDLSSHFQNLLDGLQVLHGTMRTPFVRERAQSIHPAVIRDPVTGRKALYVNSVYSERFLDMSESESDALMRFLFEHVKSPEFHVALTWRPGTTAVWEERVTQHRAIDAFTGKRKLRRITIKGDKPSA
ncbi:TauD/TfdA family dioxygenase [Phenylobacterium sp. LjRoot225]|uniref:TauD/TfdA dioxygenase family protein n=1 Tax=Phenylobacterium sp. LjRoot225 TaxID=3342285 RepID=UPI003ECF7AC2